MNISIPKNESHEKLASILDCNAKDIFENHPASGLNFIWSANSSGRRLFSPYPIEACLDGIEINEFGRVKPKK